jgi:hypothetical protein
MKQYFKKYYQVAGHIFSVQSSNSALFEMLINYQPFDITNDCNVYTNSILDLHLELDKLLSPEQRDDYTQLFVDNSEEDMPRIEVYQTKDNRSKIGKDADWLIRISQTANVPICCELQSNTDFTQGLLRIATDYPDIRFCIDNALMLMYAFRTAPLKTLEMHAAVVVKQDDGEVGYLFLGHSGTGKSTHARQWLQAFTDTWLLNDDNPILRIMDDGEIRVYGSPWSGKTPCYKNMSAPLGGVIRISRAPYNEARRLSPIESYASLMSSCSGMTWERQLADGKDATLQNIIRTVPCWVMECLPDEDAGRICCEAVTGVYKER